MSSPFPCQIELSISQRHSLNKVKPERRERERERERERQRERERMGGVKVKKRRLMSIILFIQISKLFEDCYISFKNYYLPVSQRSNPTLPDIE